MLRESRWQTRPVFVTSTFRDMHAERDWLREHVIPELEERVRERRRHLEMIDLRWGVSEEASREQQIMQICLEEIRRCQEVTPRPNFIVLLGDRYGWRPAPETIPEDEFYAVKAHLSAEDRDLPDRWYDLDENAIPPEYCLLPRKGLEYKEWQEIEARLHDALLEGTRAAGLSDEAMIRFERSATEQEIIEGALQAGTDHAFSYFREIEGLPEDERGKDSIGISPAGRSIRRHSLPLQVDQTTGFRPSPKRFGDGVNMKDIHEP